MEFLASNINHVTGGVKKTMVMLATAVPVKLNWKSKKIALTFTNWICHAYDEGNPLI